MIDSTKCISCGTCVAMCPTGAITMGEDGLPKINKELCIKCGACQNACPVSAIKIEE